MNKKLNAEQQLTNQPTLTTLGCSIIWAGAHTTIQSVRLEWMYQTLERWLD